jgi:hypothetical protein
MELGAAEEESLKLPAEKTFLKYGQTSSYFNHGGVSFIPYRKQFEKIIPSKQGCITWKPTMPPRASSGFRTGTCSDEMLLMLDLWHFL